MQTLGTVLHGVDDEDTQPISIPPKPKFREVLLETTNHVLTVRVPHEDKRSPSEIARDLIAELIGVK